MSRKTKPAPAQQPLVGVPVETYELLKQKMAELEVGVIAAYMIFSESNIFARIPHALETEKLITHLVTKSNMKRASEVRKFYPPSFHEPVEQTTDDLPEGVPQALSGTTKNNFKRRQ